MHDPSQAGANQWKVVREEGPRLPAAPLIEAVGFQPGFYTPPGSVRTSSPCVNAGAPLLKGEVRQRKGNKTCWPVGRLSRRHAQSY